MRKLLLLLVFAMLAVTGAASAATATVTITKAGYVPSSTTIAQGDSIQFVNSDTVAHQVDFKSTTGITCTPNPLVLQVGQSGTCTFQIAGTYTYSDPNVKGNTYKGTVIVKAAAESISLAAAPHVVNYGGTVALSGVLSTHKTGENVDVWATQCGSNAAKLMTVQTTTNGAYSAVVKPLMNTSYMVKVKSTSSAATAVSVRPKLSLVRLGAHRFSLKASAAINLAGKYASFQRYNGTRWVAVKTVQLRSNASGVSPTIVAAASFRSTVRAGLRVRATLGQAQVGTCYLPGISNTVRS
jgi:plastocyanin